MWTPINLKTTSFYFMLVKFDHSTLTWQFFSFLTPNSLDAQLIWPLDAKFYQRPTNSTIRRQLYIFFCFADWLKNSSWTKLNSVTKYLGGQSAHFKMPWRPSSPICRGEFIQQRKLRKYRERRQNAAVRNWLDELSERFFRTASDSNYGSWDQANQVFYDNKFAFEYNMSRLQTLEIPIAKLQARHNCSEAKEKYSQ